jgi:hypothetical protein
MVFSARAIDHFVMRWWARTREPGYGFTFARLGGHGLKHTGWDSAMAVSLLPFLLLDPDAEMMDAARGLNAVVTDTNEIQKATVALCAWTSPTPVPTYLVLLAFG